MNSDKKCVAVFDKVVVAEIKSGEGKGTIISNPTGINCGDTCYGIFNEGSSKTLQATPDSISAFKIWLGDCESCGNNPICTITASMVGMHVPVPPSIKVSALPHVKTYFCKSFGNWNLLPRTYVYRNRHKRYKRIGKNTLGEWADITVAFYV